MRQKSVESRMDQFKNFLNSGTTEAKISVVALCVVAVASTPALMLLAATMGNAVQIFKMFGVSKKYSKRQITSAFESMNKQKLIEYIRDKNGKELVRITKKGEKKLHDFSIDLIKVTKPTKWDGKWRIVMYDLPVRFKKARNSFRWKLQDLGFYQFQKSAWIYPFECEDEIIFLSDFYGVGKYVELLTVESMLDDTILKKYFNLN